jgi:hypothetical protein
MSDLNNELKALKIKVNLIETYLKTAMSLPILGPQVREAYESDLKTALAEANPSPGH